MTSSQIGCPAPGSQAMAPSERRTEILYSTPMSRMPFNDRFVILVNLSSIVDDCLSGEHISKNIIAYLSHSTVEQSDSLDKHQTQQMQRQKGTMLTSRDLTRRRVLSISYTSRLVVNIIRSFGRRSRRILNLSLSSCKLRKTIWYETYSSYHLLQLCSWRIVY